MNDTDRQRLETRASLLKSLAHPSRLLIIEMLESGPKFVGELTEAIGSDITTVSKHLSVLKRAGLVRGIKHGTFSECSLTCDCVTHFVDCIEQGMLEEEATKGQSKGCAVSGRKGSARRPGKGRA